jgi:hypothetical protein
LLSFALQKNCLWWSTNSIMLINGQKYIQIFKNRYNG